MPPRTLYKDRRHLTEEQIRAGIKKAAILQQERQKKLIRIRLDERTWVYCAPGKASMVRKKFAGKLYGFISPDTRLKNDREYQRQKAYRQKHAR